MTQIEKFEALLNEMGVWYERTDADDYLLIAIPDDESDGFKNKGDVGVTTFVYFNTDGSCSSFIP